MPVTRVVPLPEEVSHVFAHPMGEYVGPFRSAEAAWEWARRQSWFQPHLTSDGNGYAVITVLTPEVAERMRADLDSQP